MKEKPPLKKYAIIGGTTIVSYIASRMISTKLGESMGAGDVDKQATMSALTGVGLTALSVYMYPKIKDKAVLTGVIIGTGLNATVKIAKTPMVNSKLPAKIQAELKGDAGDSIPQEDFDKAVNAEIEKRIKAAQVAGVLPSPDEMDGEEIEVELPRQQQLTPQEEMGSDEIELLQ